MLLNILTHRDTFPQVDLTYTSIILYFITEHNIALSEKIRHHVSILHNLLYRDNSQKKHFQKTDPTFQ